jgi:serine/threonine protein kinase
VTRQVGEGGFGKVYEGIEVQSGHVVAIKTVSRRGLARHRVDAVLKEQVISRKVSENRGRLDASGDGSEFVVRMVSSFLTPSHFVFVLVSSNSSNAK